MRHQSWIQKNLVRNDYGPVGAVSLIVWLNDRSPKAIEERKQLCDVFQRGWNWAQKHFDGNAATQRR